MHWACLSECAILAVGVRELFKGNEILSSILNRGEGKNCTGDECHNPPLNDVRDDFYYPSRTPLFTLILP